MPALANRPVPSSRTGAAEGEAMRTLPQRLLLISLDEDGKPRDPRSSLANGLAGAALMDLVLAGRLGQEDGRLVACGGESAGDELLDFVLAEIRGQQRPRKLKWWVNRLGSGGWGRAPVRRRLIEQLTRAGVLRQGEERVLGLVPVTRHPPSDPALAERKRAAVREVLVAGREPDAALVALVALVRVCGLVDACVDKLERRAARQRAKQLSEGDQVSGAVRQLHDTEAAVLAAVIAASAASGGGGGGGGS
jgi:Golgi phosphoprotein 3 (GPP34)